ncbi:hypothetical protein [Variovorax sp. SRS16]|uniref:hypothetical protein n=1 Tax=Variovorax sp. SRS16 TaxID=282217 RepID=UPI0013A59800|nr:hypothetical protein [Variovorax sp. SRS16]
MPDRVSVFRRRLIRCVAFAGLLAACGAGAAQPTATSETTAFAAPGTYVLEGRHLRHDA